MTFISEDISLSIWLFEGSLHRQFVFLLQMISQQKNYRCLYLKRWVFGLRFFHHFWNPFSCQFPINWLLVCKNYNSQKYNFLTHLTKLIPETGKNFRLVKVKEAYYSGLIWYINDLSKHFITTLRHNVAICHCRLYTWIYLTSACQIKWISFL